MLTLWTFALGTRDRCYTSSSLTSLSFVAIKRLVGGLDCLADLFPLTCDAPFRHCDELELLEGLDVFLQRNLNYRRARFINKWALMIISRVRRHMANMCRLVHLTVTLKWLLHLTGSFLMQYMAVGYSLFYYSLLVYVIAIHTVLSSYYTVYAYMHIIMFVITTIIMYIIKQNTQ